MNISKTQTLLYSATLVSSIGNWLTFLGLALLIQKQFGLSSVPYYFLVQSLIPFLFAKKITAYFTKFSPLRIFLITQVILALNVLTLVATKSLYHILIYSGISALTIALANSVFFQMLSEKIKDADFAKISTKISAIDVAALTFAPSIGALFVIKQTNLLFILDAVSFILSAILFAWVFNAKTTVSENKQVEQNISEESHEQKLSTPAPQPSAATSITSIEKIRQSWYLFLAIGSAINALEFAAFNRAQLNEHEIALTISAWGIGALVALFLPEVTRKTVNLKWLNVVSLLFLALFAFIPNFYFLILAFAFLGALRPLTSGKLKEATVQSTKPSLIGQEWAHIQSRWALINLGVYSLFAKILEYNFFLVLAFLTVTTAALLVFRTQKVGA
jgi:hypothetical protein